MSFDDVSSWFSDNQAELIGSTLRIAAIIGAAFLLTRFLRRIVTKVKGKVEAHTTPIRTLQRTDTLTRVLSSAGIVVIWILTVFLILEDLGFNLAPLLAGVGIIGLAVGFGAQNLVRDVVTGFFILFEDQYGVGDIIEINQTASGTVETLTLRVTGLARSGWDPPLHLEWQHHARRQPLEGLGAGDSRRRRRLSRGTGEGQARPR